jgi:small subunit ribosomal protein S6
MAESEQHEYELVYVLQPDLDEQGVLGVNERLTQLIGAQSGTVTATELWGRRTLAYPIDKYFEGHYVLHRFQMPPAGAGEVDRLLRLNENVIRYLLVRTDE